MSFDIKLTINTDNLEVAMLMERVLGPVANALAEAIKPAIEELRSEVTTANAILEASRRDYENVNNQRINALNENANLIVENAALKSKQEADVAENLRLIGEVATLNEKIGEYKVEIEKLVTDGNAIAAKLRKERDDVKKELEEAQAKLRNFATRVHDIQLLLGNM